MYNKQMDELIRYRENKWKLISVGLILLIVFVLVIVLCVMVRSNTAKKYDAIVQELQEKVDELSKPTATYTVATEEVTIDLIKAEIKDIGELATIEYLYTDAGKYEDAKKLFGKDIIFTSKSFIAKWDGIIKAGVDIEKLIVEINDAKKEIIIHMPNAKILSHEIDEESVETLDERNGLFNKIKVEDVRTFDEITKGAMEYRAIENGLLDKAFENAKDIIERLVNNDAVQEQGYKIIFKEIE